MPSAVLSVPSEECSITESRTLSVATDHVIESFRNDLYAGYKNRRLNSTGTLFAVSDSRRSEPKPWVWSCGQ